MCNVSLSGVVLENFSVDYTNYPNNVSIILCALREISTSLRRSVHFGSGFVVYDGNLFYLHISGHN